MAEHSATWACLPRHWGPAPRVGHGTGASRDEGGRRQPKAVSGKEEQAMAKFENLVELFERSVKLFGPRELFGVKKHDQWVWTTYAEVGSLVDRFRGGLA